MYGQPLDPKKTQFFIDNIDGDLSIFLRDMEEPDNDDVRDVAHPDFDKLFGNEMENVFSPWPQKWIDKDNPNSGLKELKNEVEIKNWLISIGMVEGHDL